MDWLHFYEIMEQTDLADWNKLGEGEQLEVFGHPDHPFVLKIMKHEAETTNGALNLRGYNTASSYLGGLLVPTSFERGFEVKEEGEFYSCDILVQPRLAVLGDILRHMPGEWEPKVAHAFADTTKRILRRGCIVLDNHVDNYGMDSTHSAYLHDAGLLVGSLEEAASFVSSDNWSLDAALLVFGFALHNERRYWSPGIDQDYQDALGVSFGIPAVHEVTEADITTHAEAIFAEMGKRVSDPRRYARSLVASWQLGLGGQGDKNGNAAIYRGVIKGKYRGELLGVAHALLDRHFGKEQDQRQCITPYLQ